MTAPELRTIASLPGSVADPSRRLAGTAWSPSAGDHRHGQRERRVDPRGRAGGRRNPGGRPARPVARHERASPAVRRHHFARQRDLYRRDPGRRPLAEDHRLLPPSHRQRAWRKHRGAGARRARALCRVRPADRRDYAVDDGHRGLRHDHGDAGASPCLRGRGLVDAGRGGRPRPDRAVPRGRLERAAAPPACRAPCRASTPSPNVRHRPERWGIRGWRPARRASGFSPSMRANWPR